MTFSDSYGISPDYFDALFAKNDDPWILRSRWYDSKSRAMTLASLPRPRYARAFEPGCASGELSLELAARCDHLLVSDGTARAVDLARARLQTLANVEVRQAWVPDEWPTQTFDLIVISELGYYLTPDSLDELAAKTRASLRLGGTLVACHWRHPIEGCVMGGDEVHDRLARAIGLPHWIDVTELDFLIDVWCTDTESVSEVERMS